MTKPTFTLIHPSRGRPHLAHKAFRAWIDKATGKADIQYILSLDTDDRHVNEYNKLFKNPGCDVSAILNNPNANLIQAINRALPILKNDCVIVVSDDFDCPEGWDTILSKAIRESGMQDYAIYVNDDYSYGKNCMTLPIISRSLVKRLGHVYYPGYTGMFADNDLYEMFAEMKCLIHMDKKHVFPHNHYINKRAEIDDTYRRHNNNQSWKTGEDLIAKRRAINFDIDYLPDPCNNYTPILSILIATVEDRKVHFDKLINEFNRQKNKNGFNQSVQILSKSDNRKMSIGAKRQILLEQAAGDWIAFFDDDDWPYDWYIENIITAIKTNPDIDCIGINGIMTTNGKNQRKWCHRMRYQIGEYRDGFHYVRPIWHFNPVKREKALLAGFPDISFGEDKIYALKLAPLLTKEYFLVQPLFHYRYTPKTHKI